MGGALETASTRIGPRQTVPLAGARPLDSCYPSPCFRLVSPCAVRRRTVPSLAFELAVRVELLLLAVLAHVVVLWPFRCTLAPYT